MDGVLIPAVHDDNFCNSDHIPFYIDLVSDYTWDENNSRGRKIGTGKKEKTRFTVQLSCKKGGKKLQPYVIWKG